MKIVDGKEQYYKDWYRMNTYNGRTPYVFDCAEQWAEMLEKLIENSDESVAEVIAKHAGLTSIETVHNLQPVGYCWAVDILSHCWVYGEELRVWHNKKYNYNGCGVICIL